MDTVVIDQRHARLFSLPYQEDIVRTDVQMEITGFMKRLQDQECPSDDTDHLQKVFFMGESRFRKILRFPV